MSPRGKQLNGLLTQQKMLRAAVALFLESGYEKTTTAKIAKAAGMTQRSFFRAFASKEALLLELVRRMFGGQFALAEQHSGIEDPVLLYAVETSLQLHIAELTEPLRELYVVGYSLPTTSAYIYQSMAGRLQSIFGKYIPDLELKDFCIGKHHAGLHGNAVRCLFHHGSENFSLSGMLAQAVRCAAGAEKGRNCGSAANGFAAHGRGNYSEDSGTGGGRLCGTACPQKIRGNAKEVCILWYRPLFAYRDYISSKRPCFSYLETRLILFSSSTKTTFGGFTAASSGVIWQ